jgi:hypothetical protein
MRIFLPNERHEALASLQYTFSRDGFAEDEQLRTLCLKDIIARDAYQTRFQLTYENLDHPHQGKMLYISKEELLFEEKECYLIQFTIVSDAALNVEGSQIQQFEKVLKDHVFDELVRPMQRLEDSCVQLSEIPNQAQAVYVEIEKIKMMSESMNLQINDTIDLFAIRGKRFSENVVPFQPMTEINKVASIVKDVRNPFTRVLIRK